MATSTTLQAEEEKLARSERNTQVLRPNNICQLGKRRQVHVAEKGVTSKNKLTTGLF